MNQFYYYINTTPDAQDACIQNLEKWYYVSQILAAVILAITLLLTIWQYFAHKSEFEETKRLKKLEKASELAAFYKNDILKEAHIFREVYKKMGINSRIKNGCRYQMETFDKYELEKNFSDEDRRWFKDTIQSEALLESLWNLEGSQQERVFTKNIQKKALSEEEVQNKIRTELLYARNQILNNIEFFAMHFIGDIADEKFIYSVVCKTYIEIMELFYVDICLNNVKDGDDYTVNGIKLYNRWKKRYNK